VKLSDQVVASFKALHPGVKRDVRRALRDLDLGKKRDVRALGSPLVGFWRLRVGTYRVVFRYSGSGELIAEFLGPRSTVYRSFRPPASEK